MTTTRATRSLAALTALCLCACGNQLTWQIDEAVLPDATPPDGEEVTHVSAITPGSCTPTPEEVLPPGTGPSMRDVDLPAGTYCFWSLAVRRFSREGTQVGDATTSPCRLEAIGTSERTLPAEQGVVVVTENVLDASTRGAWDSALTAIVPSCAPARDPARCTCPFSGDAAACEDPISADLIAIADHWACAADTGQNDIWCWATEDYARAAATVAAPHLGDASGGTTNAMGMHIDDESFAIAQLVADHETICVRSTLGRVRCASEPGNAYGAHDAVLSGILTQLTARDVAIGTSAEGFPTACAVGITNGGEAAVRCVARHPRMEDNDDWTIDVSSPTNLFPGRILRIAVGRGRICGLAGAAVRCGDLSDSIGEGMTLSHELRSPMRWDDPIDFDGMVGPDYALGVWMRDDVTCILSSTNDVYCQTTRSSAYELVTTGSDVFLASDGIVLRTQDGLGWYGYMERMQRTGLLRGIVQGGLACGNMGDGTPLGLHPLVCDTLAGRDNPLLGPALALTTRDASAPEGTQLAVCPFVE